MKAQSAYIPDLFETHKSGMTPIQPWSKIEFIKSIPAAQATSRAELSGDGSNGRGWNRNGTRVK